jgi:cellulose synthase/poly-beta-1,6-N-acetylglucosamine synthase-like glycosyltransferase
MLERTLRAMVAMEGEHDSWLLDEGDDDDTRRLCASLGVRHYSRRGVARYNTEEGSFRGASKHGNYNAWLDEHGYAEYDVLVAFDPDHVPRRHYLARTLGYLADPRIAFVQPAQVYYNQDASFIARAAAEESYAYYSSHLMASYGMGHAIVIGSHGVHRLSALAAVGGFPAHDAEDLYLTMVYKAAGWRGVYVPEILAMGCTPTSWEGYLKQQLRWSRSMLDLKLRVLPRLAAKLSVIDRLLNLLHGAFYLRALAIPAGFLFLSALLITGTAPGFLGVRAVGTAAVLGATLALIDAFRQRYNLDPRREGGVHWRATLMQVAKWPVFAQAVWEAAHGKRPAYSITPKTNAGPQRRMLAPPQLGAALFIAVSWGVGVWRHGALAPVLHAAALLAVAIPLALAWTERWAAPPAFSPSLCDVHTGRADPDDVRHDAPLACVERH